VNEPIFREAHQALNFAHNFSRGSLDRPSMLKMADKVKLSGKGLAGLDGAAQAGFILREVQRLDKLHQHIVLAKFLPRTSHCPHCGQDVPSLEWLEAIRHVSDAAQRSGVLSGHLIHRTVRDGIVARYFGQKITLGDLAAKAGISDRTVTDQNGKITIWLRGSRLVKKGRGQFDAGTKGEEARAMERIDALLRDAGIVGELEQATA
jgi:AraC-like DNA-binding protein